MTVLLGRFAASIAFQRRTPTEALRENYRTAGLHPRFNRLGAGRRVDVWSQRSANGCSLRLGGERFPSIGLPFLAPIRRRHQRTANRPA